MPAFEYTYNVKTFDCQTYAFKVTEDIYDRNTRPLRKRLPQPYFVYQDVNENALIVYHCFDSRFLNDLVAIGLQLPEFAVAYWNKFMQIFQVFHLKIIAVISKTPQLDAATVTEVSNYINRFPYKRKFPYKFTQDFSQANQDNAKCGRV